MRTPSIQGVIPWTTGSKLGSGLVCFLSTGAALIEGGLVVVRSVEDGRLFVWAFREETAHNALATQDVRRKPGEAKD